MIDFDELTTEQLTVLSKKVFEVIRKSDFNLRITDNDDPSLVLEDGTPTPFFIVDDWEDVHGLYAAVRLAVPELNLPVAEKYTDLDFLTSLGMDWGFADSYEVCSQCSALISTQPSSYGWTPDFWVDTVNSAILCGNCIRADSEYYLDSLVNDPARANTILTTEELEQNGFRRVNVEEYENGFHPGQNDNPRQIFETLQAEHPEAEVIFHINGNGQFDTRFSAYIREQEDEEEQ